MEDAIDQLIREFHHVVNSPTIVEMSPQSAPYSSLTSRRTIEPTLTLLDSTADMSCEVQPLKNLSSFKNQPGY